MAGLDFGYYVSQGWFLRYLVVYIFKAFFVYNSCFTIYSPFY